MTRRARIVWQVLLGLCVSGMLACVVAWGVLLSNLCYDPRHPDPATQHIVAYNCHGMTVYMSLFEEAMLHWLMPALMIFILLSLIAAAMVVLSYANVRIDVQIQVKDSSNKTPDREDGSE